MSEWKRKTSNSSNSASSVGKIQSWAKGQINRAAGYIRQVSRDFAASFDEEEENAGRVRERREIVKSSDGHFFERLTIGDDIDLTTIMPNKYIETNNAQLLLDSKKPVKNCISSSKQLAERFSQFSLRSSPSKDLEQQKKHINDLYLETVYTILHRIGKKSSSASIGGVACAFGDEQLLQYAKSAFQIDEKTHKTLVEKALSEKPPILLLNVLLLEARDLIAKDIDGFSDPFVMLGVIPSSSSAKGTEEQQEQTEATNTTNFSQDSPEEEQNNSGKPPQHRRVLQRLSGSFRRKAFPVGASRREKLEAAFEQTGDGIPARIIKASSVQRKTLNPKWNEKFQFVVGDCTDRFHLDIWDHDDENRSVLDVVSSLNQVQGLKGLGRYFKEVTQSARASSGGSCGGGGDGLVDDFLGSVTFSLGEIPSTGVEQWFNLEKRSEKSEVSGQIKLKMWLSTREEHRLSSTEEQRNDDFIFLDDDADGLVDVQQHKDLLRQFSLFEIGKKGEPVCAFRGQLPDLALLILHQHAIQSDLTELHQLMCQWLAYIQMIGMGISFELIYETFSKLISKWKPMELDKDEEYVLADSLLQFSEFCRSAILRHRLRIKVRSGSRRRSPSPKRSELESFGEMLKCYRLVRESSVFAHLVSYQTHFRTEVRELLEKSAHLHFDAILLNIEENIKNNKNNNNSSAINCLYLLIHSINTTLERSSKFEELFKQEMSEIVNYADISYCTFDLLLHEHIISELTSENCSDLRAITQLCHHEENQHNNTNNITDEEQILLPILQVHLALNEFAGYRHILMTGTTGHFQYRMEQLDWSAHFDKAIQRWLEFAQVHAFSRLDLSLNLDCQSPIILLNNDIRQTVSAMDACHILEQLLFIWERLRIENMQLRASLTIRLTRLLCKISKHFTDQIIMRRSFDFSNLNKLNISEQLSTEQIDYFTALVNSCEQVRRCLACSDRLKLDEINEDGCYYDNENSTLRNQIEQQLDNCSQNIVEQIESLIDQFVCRQITKYKKAIFHLVWSPSACPTDDCLKPLIKLLDGELSLVHRCLLHRNFTRVMYSQVHLLLKLFQECINENIGQEPIFYRRLTDALAILLDFFHADGKGISVELFAQTPDYHHFLEQISIYQMSTENLIELYYRELIKAQQEVTECKYGILNLRAYFNANSQLLVIEILSAKQIIPLDSNGLSDPYVVIELLPKVHFPDTNNAKTKVVNSCLNPVFGETFEFNIPSILPHCALAHFVIMDHDFLKSNDFAGEAFLDLREVPGFASESGSINRNENQNLNRNRQHKSNNVSTTNQLLRTGNTLPLQFNLVLTHPSTRATNPTIMAVLASRKEDREADEFIRSLSATY